MMSSNKFILVEGTKTFQNNPKPLYYNDNKERFAKFADKIVHVIVDEYPEFPPIGDKKNYHDIEIFQRNYIKRGLKRCRPHNRDIVMITDVDEIIRKEKIAEIKTLIDAEGNDIVFGEFDFFRHFLNRKVPELWKITVATSWGVFNDYVQNATAFRCLGWFSFNDAFSFFETVKKRHPDKKWLFARVADIGWHFSSVGSHAAYLEKLKSWPHIRPTSIQSDEIKGYVNQLEYCEITDSFPTYLYENKELFIERGIVDSPESVYR